MVIAMYIVYLGLEKEALSLFERALQINPFHYGNQLRFGGFIHFEMGNDAKAAEYIAPPGSNSLKIADTDAYCAAIYYYLGKYDKMELYWKAFLETYKRLLRKGNAFPEQEAIDWLLKLNPHRYTTRLEEFLRYIGKGSFDAYPLQRKQEETKADAQNHFFKDTAFWRFSFDGLSVQIPEVKGFYDIRKLVTQPHQLFHCAELMGSTLDGEGTKLLDETARKQYGKKLLALQSDIQEAERLSDFIHSEKLQDEYDRLVDHLSQSLGLRGKTRLSGSTVEKARSAVTWRIRHAIARIEQHHPVLGAHLSNAVKTGTLCAYKPEREYQWVTS
jgi:hypothetical protein